MLEFLEFKYPFRKYQQMILNQTESEQNDHRYHIVAPPGSGKTIVGLELVRRFGYPAVIFAPTTTIQLQWKEKVGMFVSAPEQADEIASQDPQNLKDINIFTYQLISTTSKARESVQEMALLHWKEQLVEDGQVKDMLAAETRISDIQQNNSTVFRREVARRYHRIKRELLRNDDVNIAHFLHTNAQNLIRSLVDQGVRTIVLDECHHLLDYWAIVLRYLISQIDDPIVIGLTATLPNPENADDFINYDTLLGDVDFEVPTPAVVKEGDLAPYRDLVYFVEPSERELDYLENIDRVFDQTAMGLTTDTTFVEWIENQIIERQNSEGEQIPWEEFLYKRPIFSLAGLRFLHEIQYPFSSDLTLPREVYEPITLDDWAVLLERYGLDYLKISPDPADHERLKKLRKVLQPMGFTLTERGLRQNRSPGDLVLTFSESKDKGVEKILKHEKAVMGEDLRAVVITDFEKMSSGVSRLAGVLDKDAGSARRVFKHLAMSPVVGDLDPILVTGRTVLVDADHGQGLLDFFGRYLHENQLDARCSYKPTDEPQILELVGEGKDWRSRTYVRMVTDAFERGVTKCLVGTRGIFGEGWDSLKLNTLVDLTSVTTSTSVQQLRGRSIRLDQTWPRKVAHNWDVVCVAKNFKKGDIDFRRFIRRHNQYWGIVIPPKAYSFFEDAKVTMNLDEIDDVEKRLPPDIQGMVVKGIMHVDYSLASLSALKKFKNINFKSVNNRMIRQIKHRFDVYDYWRVGEQYSNFNYSVTQLDTKDLKIRTVFTVEDTLKRMLRSFRASLYLGILNTLVFSCRSVIIESTNQINFSLFAIIFITGLLITLIINSQKAIKIGRMLLVEQPKDAILLDVGRALLAALMDAKLVSRNLQLDFVRVIEQPDNSYRVLLDYASSKDAALFITAYRQIFEPVHDQRYLILRNDGQLPAIGLRPIWFFARGIFRDKMGYKPAYHPVPKILASRKERALSFANYWKKYVGGGQIVFTLSEQGRKILLEARAQSRPDVKGLAFEIWR